MKGLIFLQRTLGQKLLLGFTGLGLCVFMLIHMLGNLLILRSPEAYNLYAQSIHDSFILELLEKGLFITFIFHIGLAIFVNIQNKKAQGENYKLSPKGLKKTSLGKKLLVVQGVILLLFLIWHLLTFKFGTHYETLIEGQKVRDIYRLVVEVFQNPFYSIIYGSVLVILSFHLFYGFPASLRSLGFYPVAWQSTIEKISFLFAILIALGFLLPILYVLLFLN